MVSGGSGEEGVDAAARSAVVEAFATPLIEGGMQRMAARVFACLFAEDSATLSAGELAERLVVSPAAVSGAITYLTQTNMITRDRQPGSRRESYRLHHAVLFEIMTTRDRVFADWTATMREGATVLGTGTPAGRRMHRSAEFMEYMRAEIAASMERWRSGATEEARG
ncbi:GbsR/MarR family transcriptional regulator [Streptomyces bohaiensis]|uniref:GbsR/MarR family transcriptional regulator n=1 Tax=Streptomyces bohaiensis TaxID=1431344 RepID=UPI003B770F29